MSININRCNQGIFLYSRGIIDFSTKSIVMTNLTNYGLYLANNSVALMDYSGLTTGTGNTGSSITLYNCDTGILVTKNSTFSILTNSSIKNVNYGILTINNSSLFLKNSEIISKPGQSGSSNPYVGLLSQSSYVQSYDNYVTGFNTLTGPTGPSNQRVNLAGIMIVGANTDVQNTSVYTSGQIFLDTSKGDLPNQGTGIISDKNSIPNGGSSS